MSETPSLIAEKRRAAVRAAGRGLGLVQVHGHAAQDLPVEDGDEEEAPALALAREEGHGVAPGSKPMERPATNSSDMAMFSNSSVKPLVRF
jgi:hypothetical protein